MSIWDKLGIKETTDIAGIQAAYAARAKECHPEENPEEFQELQKAYKTAVKYAKNAGKANGGAVFRAREKMPENEDGSGGEEAEEPESAEAAEPAGEEAAGRGKTSEEDSEADFDYSEVQFGEAKARFFHELRYISLNPFLRNDLVCWEIFLNRPEYLELFYDASFRRNLVMTMCLRMFGWQRKTIRYVDGFLKQFQGDMRKPETELACWRRRRSALLPQNPFTVLLRTPSKEQAAINTYLWTQVKRSLGGDDFTKREAEALERYLELYFSYAERNIGRLEKLDRQRHTQNTMLISLLCGGVFWVCLSIYMNAWYRENSQAGGNGGQGQKVTESRTETGQESGRTGTDQTGADRAEPAETEYFFSWPEAMPEYVLESTIGKKGEAISDLSDIATLFVGKAKELEKGTLYFIHIVHPAGVVMENCPPNEKWFAGEEKRRWDRLQLGWFYVTEDAVYLIRGDDIREQVQTDEDAIALGTLVCSAQSTEDKLAEDEKGWHEHIEVNGNRCTWYGYANYGDTNFYERFVWEKGRGLVQYFSGYGARRDYLEIRLADGTEGEAKGVSGESDDAVALNAVVISPEGDFLPDEQQKYQSEAEFLSAYGFAGEKPAYYYYRKDGTLQLKFFWQRGEDFAVCVRYTDGENMTYRDQEGVIQGYVFQGIREAAWDCNPYSVKPVEENEYPGALEPVCEYDDAGQLTRYHLEGRAKEIFSSQALVPFVDIRFSYRGDGTLEGKEYWHNPMLFGTYRQQESSFFDEQERLLYQSSYITHGRCESYYFYRDGSPYDEREPLFRLYLDYNGSQYGFLEKYCIPRSADACDTYAELLDFYAQAFGSRWNMDMFADADISPIYASLSNNGKGLQWFGYQLRDLDGDGTEELLIGSVDQSGYNRGMLYEMYTLQGGKPFKILRSVEGCSYHLCADGLIAYDCVIGNSFWECSRWSYKGAEEFELVEAVIHDNWDYDKKTVYQDGEHYYYYDRPVKAGALGSGLYRDYPVSAQRGEKLMQELGRPSWEELEFIPFSEYLWQGGLF